MRSAGKGYKIWATRKKGCKGGIGGIQHGLVTWVVNRRRKPELPSPRDPGSSILNLLYLFLVNFENIVGKFTPCTFTISSKLCFPITFVHSFHSWHVSLSTRYIPGTMLRSGHQPTPPVPHTTCICCHMPRKSQTNLTSASTPGQMRNANFSSTSSHTSFLPAFFKVSSHRWFPGPLL